MGAPGFFQRPQRQECGPVPFLQAAVPGAAETEKKNTKAQGLYDMYPEFWTHKKLN